MNRRSGKGSSDNNQRISDKSITKKLVQLVGQERVSRQEEDLICHSYDATMKEYKPGWVIWPDSSRHVSEIARIANLHQIPITPRGAGTGLSGGALPLRGGIVLSFTRMNRIISIDPENLIAEVEPGVINAELDRQAGRFGLFYPPDPASHEFSTIGGNVAESAGGLRAVKYGVTRDYVLGLEAVLPTGEIIVTGSRTTKCVVGYDLTRLFVGSEGTLAIFTKLFLRLVPRPEAITTLLALFPDVHSAARTVSAIIARKIIPTTLEFMDQSSIKCVEEYANINFDEKTDSLLLIEIDGPQETIHRQSKIVRDICLSENAIDVTSADADEERNRLWKARRAVSPALHKIAPDKFNEDVVVPRSRVPELITQLDQIARTHDLIIISFGHAGDGNIHVNIMTDLRIKGSKETVQKALKDIFQLTIDLGGTISGEHGIGITKAPFLDMELNEATINTMKKIKNTFDPNNILNPGKMFSGSFGT